MAQELEALETVLYDSHDQELSRTWTSARFLGANVSASWHASTALHLFASERGGRDQAESRHELVRESDL